MANIKNNQKMPGEESEPSYIVQKIYDTKNNIMMTANYSLATTENIRILIVDDDAGTREMLLSALSHFGFEATAARNGSEALALFLTNHFELIITDLQMPGMDGWSLASNIKRILPGMPVMMMTAQAKGHVIKDLEKSCFDSALFKPFKLEQLQQEIQRLLGSTAKKKTH
jgi:two-component system capsular synthesis sensor histidine kinase RcsC